MAKTRPVVLRRTSLPLGAAAAELRQYKEKLIASTEVERNRPAEHSPSRGDAEKALRALGYIQ